MIRRGDVTTCVSRNVETKTGSASKIDQQGPRVDRTSALRRPDGLPLTPKSTDAVGLSSACSWMAETVMTEAPCRHLPAGGSIVRTDTVPRGVVCRGGVGATSSRSPGGGGASRIRSAGSGESRSTTARTPACLLFTGPSPGATHGHEVCASWPNRTRIPRRSGGLSFGRVLRRDREDLPLRGRMGPERTETTRGTTFFRSFPLFLEDHRPDIPISQSGSRIQPRSATVEVQLSRHKP